MPISWILLFTFIKGKIVRARGPANFGKDIYMIYIAALNRRTLPFWLNICTQAGILSSSMKARLMPRWKKKKRYGAHESIYPAEPSFRAEILTTAPESDLPPI